MSILEQIAVIFAPWAVAIVCLYFWAAVCFLFFKGSCAETEDRLRGFLQRHYSFFIFSFASDSPPVVTVQLMKKAGSRGWWMTMLPAGTMGFALNYHTFLLSNGVLFFGGLMFAYSWYGIRCLRLLGLESYANNDA